jgi:hypothetical protein
MTTETGETTASFADFEKAHMAPEAPAPAPEPAVEAEPADEPELAAAPEPEGDEQPEQPEQKKRSTADRIKKMTRELREAQAVAAQVAELKQQLEELRNPKPLTSEPEPAKEASVSAPDPAKYQYGELDPQFMRDLARFEAKQEAAQLREELRKEAEQESRTLSAQREVAALQETAATIEQAGISKYPDFKSIVIEGAQAGDWALTKEMLVMAAETSVAPDVLYYLASNPEESAKVAEMSERQQAMWFGRMEAQFAAKIAPAARKVSQAPPPVSSVRGRSGQFAASPDTNDFSAFERMAMAKGR